MCPSTMSTNCASLSKRCKWSAQSTCESQLYKFKRRLLQVVQGGWAWRPSRLMLTKLRFLHQLSPNTQNYPFIWNLAKSLFDICYMHSMVLTFLELFLLLREDLPVETSAPTQVTFSFRSLPTSSSSPSLDSPGSRRITPWKWRFSLKIQWFHIFVRSLVEDKCVAGNK